MPWSTALLWLTVTREASTVQGTPSPALGTGSVPTVDRSDMEHTDRMTTHMMSVIENRATFCSA